MRSFWWFVVVLGAGCASAPPASDTSRILTGEDYARAIMNHVARYWVQPKPSDDPLNCEFLISQDRNGVVQTIAVSECNGSEQEVESIQRAIEKASPLPLPDNEALFDPDIRLSFRSRSNCDQSNIPCSDNK